MDLLPRGTERQGILLDAGEELCFGWIGTLGNELLECPPDVIKSRGGWEFRGIFDVQKLGERA
jgi:hypothetical protein